ncbi:MAG: GxxExxY protein [Saprospiraceae bacterium]|nr:GxxExxY protein [Saprospiraceae bacterium]
MRKKFTVTGKCIPAQDYMADVSKKLAQTLRMVEMGDYFIINRPRQYGKTTTLYTLARTLRATADYIVFNTSFEGIDEVNFEEEQQFASGFVRLLGKSMQVFDPENALKLLALAPTIKGMNALSDFITDFTSKTDKKVVLFIDEVDQSSNNELFVRFLALLMSKYLARDEVKTFHSIVLAGLHDVKSLKLKLRRNEQQKYNSPWNIAADFKINMNLQPSEIKSMLEDYTQDSSIKMDTEWFANRLFYFTSGYPYLVSKLCKVIDEEILPEKTVQEWTEDDLNEAFNLIFREANNTNFDTLVKNLEHYPDLYQLVFSLIFDSEKVEYSQHDALVNLGTLHGILGRSESGHLIIHNRVYRELIANMMVSKWRTSNIGKFNPMSAASDFRGSYRLPNGGLDMEKVMYNFQVFMRENHSDKDRKFLERDGRIIFLAFLKPILNGSGFEFKEPQISDERRLDIVITYNQFKYVVELKVWYGEVAHEKGLIQLTDYLERQGLDTGYLVIFDHSKKKTWKKEWIEVEGKRILWARV